MTIKDAIASFEQKLADARIRTSEILENEEKAFRQNHQSNGKSLRRERLRICSEAQAAGAALERALSPKRADHLKNLAKCLRTSSEPPDDPSCELSELITRVQDEHSNLGSAADGLDTQTLDGLANRLDAAAEQHTAELRSSSKDIARAAARMAEFEALARTQRAVSEAVEADRSIVTKTDPAVIAAKTQYRDAIATRRKISL